MSTIQYCDPDDIMLEKREDGHLLNPRHRTGDSTDLTLSAQEANGRIIMPLLLYRNGEGQLVAGGEWGGHNRGGAQAVDSEVCR